MLSSEGRDFACCRRLPESEEVDSPCLSLSFPPSLSILRHKLPNHLKQLARTIGLCQVSRGASILRLLVVATERERGDHDNRDRGGLGISAKHPGRVQPRQLRKLDIHKNQVRQLAERRLHP